MTPETFIEYWRDKGGSERANYQKFITELCVLIGTAAPEASSEDDRRNDYVFERRVRAMDVAGEDGRYNYIDCYKRDCFILEAKQSRKRLRQAAAAQGGDLFGGLPAAAPPPRQGMAWDRMMKEAQRQAERYARALPPDHDWPPFLVIVDVGHVIETYADFTGMGRIYMPFPDSRSHRVRLDDLAQAPVRDRLKAIWQAPKSLDPAAHRAEVTRDIAERLARLAVSLEKRHPPKTVALFLMRCLFTAFAEDVGLLPEDAFLHILQRAAAAAQHLPRYLTPLWRSMDTGSEFEPMIDAKVLYFNGGLFRNAEALPLTEDEIGELIAACIRDWRNVEPAIFGTLLENALDPRERGMLGAHFTPRDYVERLVAPTVIEPLLTDWRAVEMLAAAARDKGDTMGAVELVADFHRRLCAVRVLDPACGTGNFLYVTLELMKRLEGVVLLALEELGGGNQGALGIAGHHVGPSQFLGLEKNPRAVPIAELVIWLGQLQQHLRQRGLRDLGEPILRTTDTIREADALLTWTREELVRDGHGRPVSRWDGVTTRTDSFTGRVVPDETAVVELKRYHAPQPAEWPEADFIVGNPPFIGGKDLRQELGDGYAEALWAAYPHMPGGADIVMYWWDKAAAAVRTGRARRFGFITTNSITQTFNRRVIGRHLKDKAPLHLAFAIADHPWADGHGAAAVRIAMTVAAPGGGEGVLKTVTAEGDTPDRDGAVPVELSVASGVIQEDLTIGPAVAAAEALKANDGLASPGMKLHGSGFIVTPAEAKALGLGDVPGLERYIRPYRNGRDLTARPRGVMVTDLFGLSETQLRQQFPAVYQWVKDRLFDERQAKAGTPDGKQYAEKWWLFGKPRQELRRALAGLSRYIVTVETAQHRIFQFLESTITPDNRLVVFGSSDQFLLGVLSSKIHVIWCLAAGALLEDRPIYTKTRCFDPFPFPDATPEQRRCIGALAEELDAHRKRVLAEHPRVLTLTGLYNVLEKRRTRVDLDEGDLRVYELGQVGVMLDLHDRIDRAVAAAYGWPADLGEGEILAHLVDLNAERRREEEAGTIRWLRPDFQNPGGTVAPTQMAAELLPAVTDRAKPLPWPKEATEQVRVLLAALRHADGPQPAEALARRFKGARLARVRELLDVMASFGQARRTADGNFTS